ncbi:abhydrolase domain-containing protein 12 [Coniochaeta ligniaria NRRL 30616]|uniref:Abhydrolase domain-containing protein 12 n=1 Tax=Coniochaeta ligniaria NRRL 30616 TaxID=1408157 RepID=A0A1J7IDQ0_9PEZI|nr:abhydrolase domain-containing protein 12 [Coniochaeta ligniaria NRRL 30616]
MTLRAASVLWSLIIIVGAVIGLYATFVAIVAIPALQNQVVYLNKVTLTWFQDVSVPEQWGFLRNQVTPFTLETVDGESLHAWHILPLGFYQRHEDALTREPAGIAHDITDRLCFQLLRDDPDSLLVLYFHGAAGTLGSGWRPPSYRAMSAASPEKIHTIAIDYRGFGSSSGSPSEDGLLVDATTLADFALNTIGIAASRIVIFGQSLGTAVGISLTHRLATMPEPTLFNGMVLVAPFADVELLTATYRVVGTIPILDPVARFPKLLTLLNSFIISKWASKDKLAAFVRHVEHLGQKRQTYHITIIHAEDDYDVPWAHSEKVFGHAVNATSATGTSFADTERYKSQFGQLLGAGGRIVEWKAERGLIREEITKYGLHDRIMSYPVVSMAVARAFQSIVQDVS